MNIWEFIFKLASVIIGFLIILVLFTTLPQVRNVYEYIDLDGNKGLATNCSYKFEKQYKGGQGSPVCELEDGTVLSVKQYKLIESTEYIPFNEIFKGE